jgi:hypothetical protein
MSKNTVGVILNLIVVSQRKFLYTLFVRLQFPTKPSIEDIVALTI